MMTRRSVTMMGLAAAGVLLPLAALHPVARAQASQPRSETFLRERGRVVRFTKANASMSAVHAVPGETDAMQLLTQGQSLSPQAAAGLERKLAASPNDLPDHIRLLGYDSPWQPNRHPSFSAVKNAYDAQVFWLIQNHPESVLLGMPYTLILKRQDAAGFHQGEALWLAQVAKQPQNTLILGKAAEFCVLSDPPTAERLLKQAAAVEPQNPHWRSQLGDFYRLQMIHASTAAKSSLAQEAFDAYAAAYQMDKQTPFLSLDALANAASDAAERTTVRQYANDLLRRSESAQDYYSSVDFHFANLALGRLAFQEGNIAEADADLLAAGHPAGPVSPALSIFGPGMSLAKDLLERGERQSVLTYLTDCCQFTTYKKADLQGFITQVHQGKTPNFGIYLFS